MGSANFQSSVVIYLSRVEVFPTGIKLNPAIKAIFGGRSTDQGGV